MDLQELRKTELLRQSGKIIQVLSSLGRGHKDALQAILETKGTSLLKYSEVCTAVRWVLTLLLP